jgi:N,N'-diacetyllegionaminate synthase
VRIGRVDLNEAPLVMAEIGNNHEGRTDVARELVERAAEAGADAVKLQVFDPSRFVRPSQRDRLEQLSRFQLPDQELAALCEQIHSLGLLAVATPLDLESVGFLEGRVDALKIASGDNDFFPLIERVADTELPMIISSGLAEVGDIRKAKGTAEGRWAERGIQQEVAVLHCVSAYPVDPEAWDLGRIRVLAEALGCTVGYSDHAIGIEACVAAAAIGARIIEKHFTLDHDFSNFRDHKLSAEPGELAKLVREVRRASAEGEDEPPATQGAARRALEEPNRNALRRSIVAGAELRRGHRLELGDLAWMRPRDGLAPGEEDLLLGRTLRRDLRLGETITTADVEGR